MKYIRIKSFLINLENVCQIRIAIPRTSATGLKTHSYHLDFTYKNGKSEMIGMDNQTELNSYVEQIEVNIK